MFPKSLLLPTPTLLPGGQSVAGWAIQPRFQRTCTGQVRGGAGAALVGSNEEVAERIEEYHDLGIDEFILSGYPHLEESYWFGEGVLPILASRRSSVVPSSTTRRNVFPDS